MAIYSTNRFANLDADRVELSFRESAPDVTDGGETVVSEAPDVTEGGEVITEAPDVTDGGTDIVAEAVDLDALLEALE